MVKVNKERRRSGARSSSPSLGNPGERPPLSAALPGRLPLRILPSRWRANACAQARIRCAVGDQGSVPWPQPDPGVTDVISLSLHSAPELPVFCTGVSDVHLREAHRARPCKLLGAAGRGSPPVADFSGVNGRHRPRRVA